MMRGGDVKRRKRRCKKGGEDRISLLPDDILISILSRLTSKQATSTAILSTRWRSLYAFATRIDLPQPAPTKKCLPPIPTTTSTVDHVLNSHRGGRVKEFKVDVSCKSEEGASIGKWFDFALAKGAEVIDVSLSLSGNYPRLEQTVFNHNGGCLRELSLSRIDVDDRDLVLLLRSFPLLERLTVSTSSLRNPSIVGHSTCKLKHLVISGNQFLESIEIDGLTSLVSLGCYALSSRHSLSLRNVPKLVDFSTRDLIHYTIPSTFSKFPSIGDQIQSLKLYWHSIWESDYNKLHMQFLGMRNLDLTFPLSYYPHDEYLDGLLRLIQACPSLEKLEIKVNWSRSRSESRKERVARANEENKIIWVDWRSLPELKLSPDLKKVKLSGFVGTSSELEFALSIMKNVVALEELVVEACGDKKRRALATHRARQHFVPTMLPYPFTLLVI